ncbi:MAG: FHA domain-containing protein [Acidobacteriia bacterium]|nr:FHA domain-containing protein [Terriglobia bacterium]
MVELILLDGSGRRFPLNEGEELMVGVAARCSVRLSALDVSRAHALLTSRNGKTIVLDLGSTNGTFVNGKRVKEAELAPGDSLRFSSVMAQVLPATSDQSGNGNLRETGVRVAGPEAGELGAKSPSSDQMPVVVHESLEWLLSHWSNGGRSAQEEFVEWLVGQRGLRGAAILQDVDGEIVVAAAQGEIGAVLEDPACLELVRGSGEGAGSTGGISVTIAHQAVLAMKAPELPWLVLVPRLAMPDFAELSLVVRLLGVARRLDRGR